MQSPGHLMIMEDDALFGPHSCQIISAAAQSMSDATWDILFTDACIPSVLSMLDLFLLRRQLVSAMQIKAVNLKEIRFAGSTAYVLNSRSKEKLLGLLKRTPVLDLPYDLALRSLIHESALNGFMTFPFATSLSEHAELSQIGGGNMEINDATWNAFRKLMWADRNIAEATERLDRIGGAFLDAETVAFAKILAIMLSPKLPNK
jgi:GR25 family glycosyltransferase involved in LPS biosynthesis